MEINSYEEITGVITTADVVDGRFGVFTSHSFTHDFGSRTDLPGFKVPASAEEANNARQLITWAQTQQPFPAILPVPAVSWSLRRGFGATTNSPFSATMYLTNPAFQPGMTIASGVPSLAFGKGTYTFPSGAYVYAAGLETPGALVQVCNTSEDTTNAGKLKLLSTYSSRKVGTVRQFHSTTSALTVDID